MNTPRTLLAVMAFFLTLLSDLAFLLIPGPSCIPFSGCVPGVLPNTSQQSALSEQLSGKILRLHIIADNDSAEAQAVKLLVRDAVCNYLSPLPEGVNSKEAVCDYLNLHMQELIAIADEVLLQNACNYHATATVGKRYFPLKTYGAYAFPPGDYDALCITLGSGQGQNWWCLAFPSLCLLDGTYAVTAEDSEQQLKILLTDEEYEAILIQEPKIRFRFRLLEWLKGKYK